MKIENIIFSINTNKNAVNVIKISKKLNIKPTLYIKNYLIKGFGNDWFLSFKKLLEKKFPKYSFCFCVDAGSDFGLCIFLIKEKVKFIKIRSNKLILNKINEIARKNRVVLNPTFRVVEVANIKNLEKKILKDFVKELNENRRKSNKSR